MRKHWAGLLLAPLLSGCPSSSDDGAASTAVARPALVDARTILEANAQDPAVEVELASIATGAGPATNRFLALRKLEQVNAPSLIATSEALAKTSDGSETSALLRNNAVAILLRSQRPEAKNALSRAKAASPEAAVVAARLEHAATQSAKEVR